MYIINIYIQKPIIFKQHIMQSIGGSFQLNEARAKEKEE